MRKKSVYSENLSSDENEFDVDEPDEIQNNASDDDWTPDKESDTGRRASNRLRNIPKSRTPIIDASSSDDEDNSDDSGSSKRKIRRGRPYSVAKRPKVSSTSNTPAKSLPVNGKSVGSDNEPSSTTNTISSPSNEFPVNVSKEFTSGAFVVLKTDAANLEQDPPIWKIDGKALLQKYVAFEENDKTLYKNTSVYSGWTLANKDNYYPITVTFKQQTRKEHIVAFSRDQIQLLLNNANEISSTQAEGRSFSSSEDSCSPPEEPKKPVEKGIIKVKSFATVIDKEVSPANLSSPVVEKVVTPDIQEVTDKPSSQYNAGTFLVLRDDAAKQDPPLWKIDGKALLQKFVPFDKNGETLYKSTAEYSGWTAINKSDYFSTSVIFKSHHRKNQIVKLERIKWDEPEEVE